MKTKIFVYIIIALLLINIGQFIFYKKYIKDKFDIEEKYQKLILQEKQKERNKAYLKSSEIIDSLINKIDILYNENKKTKYVPYIKIKYIDRTIDDAVKIIDSSKY